MNSWQLLLEAGRVARQYRRVLLWALLGVALGVGALLPFDHPWNDWLLHDQPEAWVTLADRFSYWGDFHTGTFILCSALWLAGWWRQRPRWRVAALVATVPPVGIPVMIGASGVVWSRLYKSAHYPSDVWAGACIGLLHGLVFAAAARRLVSPTGQP